MTKECLWCSKTFTPKSPQQKMCSAPCQQARARAMHNDYQKARQRKPPEQCGWCLRRGWGPCVKHGGLSAQEAKLTVIRKPTQQASQSYEQMVSELPDRIKRLSQRYDPRQKIGNVIG